ncbi:porin family protein [Chryseosolibacter indicus]|uniref:Outer membrane beta-barrel protein n=1 Tax=Chryseosolibacter indicus TaxID=2782351 RepID=A0ABS5VMW4_9BACT|nr:porin family protein [Chryseosolibacter indicus]MBT1702792.1 outer membrane beta-barrel protein [Chryseosolibacter indicus]
MQTIDVRNQHNLYWKKIVLLIGVFVLCLSTVSQAQRTRWVQKNNPNYDDRKFTYGFLIGIHSSSYRVKYSDRFVTPAFDTVYSVDAKWSPGFALGFIVNYKLADFFDLRLTPSVAFLENKLTYRFTDETKTHEEVVETSMVEIPLLLKYKSERRGNVRMYMIGGVKPSIEVSGKKQEENVTGSLEVTGSNLSLDFGFGFDLYYPLFKFSPEIRFSKGMVDILDNKNNSLGQPLNRLSTNTITVYFLFQ